MEGFYNDCMKYMDDGPGTVYQHYNDDDAGYSATCEMGLRKVSFKTIETTHRALRHRHHELCFSYSAPHARLDHERAFF